MRCFVYIQSTSIDQLRIYCNIHACANILKYCTQLQFASSHELHVESCISGSITLQKLACMHIIIILSLYAASNLPNFEQASTQIDIQYTCMYKTMRRWVCRSSRQLRSSQSPMGFEPGSGLRSSGGTASSLPSNPSECMNGYSIGIDPSFQLRI